MTILGSGVIFIMLFALGLFLTANGSVLAGILILFIALALFVAVLKDLISVDRKD